MAKDPAEIVQLARAILAEGIRDLEASANHSEENFSYTKDLLYFCHDSEIISDQEFASAVAYLDALKAPPPDSHWWASKVY